MMENLKKLREEKGVTQQELALLLGVTRTLIGKYEKHDVMPPLTGLIKLANYFGVSIDYLVGYSDHRFQKPIIAPEHSELINIYEASNEQAKDAALVILTRALRFNSPSQRHQKGNDARPSNEGTVLPIVGRAVDAPPAEVVQEAYDAVTLEDGSTIQPGDFVVVAAGDSMIGAGIKNGDGAVIRRQETVENGEIALVALNGGGSMIRKFFKEDDGYRLVPANPNFPTLKYPKNYPIRIMGKVVKII